MGIMQSKILSLFLSSFQGFQGKMEFDVNYFLLCKNIFIFIFLNTTVRALLIVEKRALKTLFSLSLPFLQKLLPRLAACGEGGFKSQSS